MIEFAPANNDKILNARQQEIESYSLERLIDSGGDVDLALLDSSLEKEKISKNQYDALLRRLQERSELIEGGLELATKKLNKEKKRTEKELKKVRVESISDSLTGILNRRGLEKELDAAKHRLNPEKTKKSFEKRKRKAKTDYILFFMMDVNQFKFMNDKYGHSKGDEALKLIAEVIDKEAGERMGHAARFGGDEFVIIQEGQGSLTEAHLEEISKRLQKKINSFFSVPIKDGSLGFSLYVGASILRKGEDKTIEQLKEEADAQLYFKKHRRK